MCIGYASDKRKKPFVFRIFVNRVERNENRKKQPETEMNEHEQWMYTKLLENRMSVDEIEKSASRLNIQSAARHRVFEVLKMHKELYSVCNFPFLDVFFLFGSSSHIENISVYGIQNELFNLHTIRRIETGDSNSQHNIISIGNAISSRGFFFLFYLFFRWR